MKKQGVSFVNIASPTGELLRCLRHSNPHRSYKYASGFLRQLADLGASNIINIQEALNATFR